VNVSEKSAVVNVPKKPPLAKPLEKPAILTDAKEADKFSDGGIPDEIMLAVYSQEPKTAREILPKKTDPGNLSSDNAPLPNKRARISTPSVGEKEQEIIANPSLNPPVEINKFPEDGISDTEMLLVPLNSEGLIPLEDLVEYFSRSDSQ
jgi:hypothetical protein